MAVIVLFKKWEEVRMKIAIFTDTFYPDINGVARTLKRLTDYLQKNHISYKVFAPRSNSTEYVSSHIHRFQSLPFFLYPECKLAIPNFAHIKKEIHQFAPDLIHVATPFNMGLTGVYFAKKQNIPLVGSYHTDFDQYLKYYDMEFLEKWVWQYMPWFHRSFEKLFVPSLETLLQLKKRNFHSLDIWPRGVDCQLFHPRYNQNVVREKYKITKKYILTFVGRLAPEKDIKTLLTIAQSLPVELEEKVQWLIVGDGPLRDELKRNVPKNMLLTGYLKGEELAEVYCSSDLFVFPSPTETFGNVVLEALASSTPVIAANSGGVKNIIQSGLTGYLCEPGDAIGFSETIKHILDHDSKRKQMAFEGRQYALSQDWNKIFDQLVHSYLSVINHYRMQKFA
jgi:glycosyltransferase involved in cell wall biosynthesis